MKRSKPRECQGSRTYLPPGIQLTIVCLSGTLYKLHRKIAVSTVSLENVDFPVCHLCLPSHSTRMRISSTAYTLLFHDVSIIYLGIVNRTSINRKYGIWKLSNGKSPFQLSTSNSMGHLFHTSQHRLRLFPEGLQLAVIFGGGTEPWKKSIALGLSNWNGSCLTITIWLFNIAMENHHF